LNNKEKIPGCKLRDFFIFMPKNISLISKAESKFKAPQTGLIVLQYVSTFFQYKSEKSYFAGSIDV